MFMRYVGGGVGHRNQAHAEAYEDELDENDEINIDQARGQEDQHGTDDDNNGDDDDDDDEDEDEDEEDNYQHDSEDGEGEGNDEDWEGEGDGQDGYDDYGYDCL
jgi:hypothetical protein